MILPLLPADSSCSSQSSTCLCYTQVGFARPFRAGLKSLSESLNSSAAFAVVVLQSGDQLSHPGGAVMLGCRMGPGLSMSSYTMLWYRQTGYRAALEFVTKEYAPGSGPFQAFIDGAKNNFSLQVTQLSPDDSSTYYCAASHSRAAGAGRCTNICKRKEPASCCTFMQLLPVPAAAGRSGALRLTFVSASQPVSADLVV